MDAAALPGPRCPMRLSPGDGGRSPGSPGASGLRPDGLKLLMLLNCRKRHEVFRSAGVRHLGDQQSLKRHSQQRVRQDRHQQKSQNGPPVAQRLPQFLQDQAAPACPRPRNMALRGDWWIRRTHEPAPVVERSRSIVTNISTSPGCPSGPEFIQTPLVAQFP